MTVDVQIACSCSDDLPSDELLTQWVNLATQQRKGAEIVVRLVGKGESAELNEAYREKTGPTNVLSFPFEKPEGMPVEALTEDILGDLIICAPIVFNEAKEQRKKVADHWAHMTIHGCLHLQGYDHGELDEAQVMEALEIKLLKSIGIKNPYEG